MLAKLVPLALGALFNAGDITPPTVPLDPALMDYVPTVEEEDLEAPPPTLVHIPAVAIALFWWIPGEPGESPTYTLIVGHDLDYEPADVTILPIFDEDSGWFCEGGYFVAGTNDLIVEFPNNGDGPDYLRACIVTNDPKFQTIVHVDCGVNKDKCQKDFDKQVKHIQDTYGIHPTETCNAGNP